MLTMLKHNRSLTFYQTPMKVYEQNNYTFENTTALDMVAVSEISFASMEITNRFNTQLNQYVLFNEQEKQKLILKTQEYMNKIYQKNPYPTTKALRDINTFLKVKHQVIREELMKLQIGNNADLSLSKEQLAELKLEISDKDLTLMKDEELKSIINKIIKPDDTQYLTALREFKESGKVSELLQKSKLDLLKDELANIDLDKISPQELKELKDKFLEKKEFHHKESISSNPNEQSNPDNIDVLNTSEHDRKHTHIDKNGNKKIDYKKPVKEEPNNRNQELKDANKKRVFKNELKGLGMAVAIGMGVGFTIGFVVTLAQSGISMESLKNAVATGTKAGLESGIMSGVGYGLARTIGEIASQKLTGFVENIGITVTENISKIVNMLAIGTLTIMAFTTYQFVKLKIKGVSTRESLIQVGKQALFSLSVLVVSASVQAIFGGVAGMIPSIGIGVFVITYSVVDSINQRKFSEKLREYVIDKYYPFFQYNIS